MERRRGLILTGWNLPEVQRHGVRTGHLVGGRPLWGPVQGPGWGFWERVLGSCPPPLGTGAGQQCTPTLLHPVALPGQVCRFPVEWVTPSPHCPTRAAPGGWCCTHSSVSSDCFEIQLVCGLTSFVHRLLHHHLALLWVMLISLPSPPSVLGFQCVASARAPDSAFEFSLSFLLFPEDFCSDFYKSIHP